MGSFSPAVNDDYGSHYLLHFSQVFFVKILYFPIFVFLSAVRAATATAAAASWLGWRSEWSIRGWLQHLSFMFALLIWYFSSSCFTTAPVLLMILEMCKRWARYVRCWMSNSSGAPMGFQKTTTIRAKQGSKPGMPFNHYCVDTCSCWHDLIWSTGTHPFHAEAPTEATYRNNKRTDFAAFWSHGILSLTWDVILLNYEFSHSELLRPPSILRAEFDLRFQSENTG